jgi:hypothetical protein
MAVELTVDRGSHNILADSHDCDVGINLYFIVVFNTSRKIFARWSSRCTSSRYCNSCWLLASQLNPRREKAMAGFGPRLKNVEQLSRCHAKIFIKVR